MADTTTPARNVSWSKTVEVAAVTDVGMRRATNQDAYLVRLAETVDQWRRRGHLFVVADGMGAHVAGELASKLAVQQVSLHYEKRVDAMPPAEALHQAIVAANLEIHRRGQANPEFHNMGTTCSALVLLPEGAVVGHVGDSRVYQLRGNRLDQLTFDHSLVWELHAAGDVTEETARSGVIPKNVITRSLGPNATVEVDLEGPFSVKVGDRFLLCSDGLSGQIPDEELGALLRCLPPAQAAQFLVDLANLRGGPDNITCIVVEVVSPQIETHANAGIPLNRISKAGKFPPLLAFTTLVCWLAAALLYFVHTHQLALVAGVLGFLAALTGLFRMIGASGDREPGQRYGRGPHRRYRVRPTRELFEQLAGLVKSLRESADEHGWAIDREGLDTLFAKACNAADRNNFVEAVRLEANVITDLMRQIRHAQRNGPNEDTVDL